VQPSLTHPALKDVCVFSVSFPCLFRVFSMFFPCLFRVIPWQILLLLSLLPSVANSFFLQFKAKYGYFRNVLPYKGRLVATLAFVNIGVFK